MYLGIKCPTYHTYTLYLTVTSTPRFALKICHAAVMKYGYAYADSALYSFFCLS